MCQVPGKYALFFAWSLSKRKSTHMISSTTCQIHSAAILRFKDCEHCGPSTHLREMNNPMEGLAEVLQQERTSAHMSITDLGVKLTIQLNKLWKGALRNVNVRIRLGHRPWDPKQFATSWTTLLHPETTGTQGHRRVLHGVPFWLQSR